jgi:hypothetical protein
MYSSRTLPQDDEYHERDVVGRDLGGGHDSFGQRFGMATEGSEYGGRLGSLRPGTSHRSSDFESEQLASDRPSIGKRILHTVARFCFVFLIGVSATLAWQSYHEEVKEMVRTLVPSLGWLLPPLPASAEPSELGQQLKPMVFDLALVRRSIEQLAADLKQLAAKQEQIAHDISTLQAVERDLRQNISSVPPPGAVQIPRPKPGQPSAQSLAAH